MEAMSYLVLGIALASIIIYCHSCRPMYWRAVGTDAGEILIEGLCVQAVTEALHQNRQYAQNIFFSPRELRAQAMGDTGNTVTVQY